MEELHKQIQEDLKSASDERTMISFQRFFKEPVKAYGVKTTEVDKIARYYWKQIKEGEKEDIFSLCELLYKSDYNEEAFIVSFWSERFKEMMEEEDIVVFEKWIYRYINNWAKCDGFCNHAVGDYIQLFPRKMDILYTWAKSPNRWMRRASAVSLITPARKGQYLKQAFLISELLLMDLEELVQKGYGWLLKEESRKHQQEVLDFVISHKKNMPRIALRYAIELMPSDLKFLAMQK